MRAASCEGSRSSLSKSAVHHLTRRFSTSWLAVLVIGFVAPAHAQESPIAVDSAPTPSACEQPLDLIWLIDSSTQLPKFDSRLISFLRDVSSRLGISPSGIHASAVLYTGPVPGTVQPAVQIKSLFSSSRDGFDAVLNGLVPMPYGYSRTDIAFAVANQILSSGPPRRSGVKALVIVVTDSNPEDGYLSPNPCLWASGCQDVQGLAIAEATKLRAAGFMLAALGIGPEVAANTVAQWVTTQSLAFYAPSVNDLSTLVEPLSDTICYELPDITPAPTLPPALVPNTPPPAPATPQTLDCNKQLNLALLLDGSGSIGDQFPYETTFAADLIALLNVTDDTVNAGIIQFRGASNPPNDTTNPPVRIEHDISGNQTALVDAVNSIERLTDGWTRTDLALDDATKMLLGYPRNVPKVIVLVTDGLPEDGYLKPPCRWVDNCTLVSTWALMAADRASSAGITLIAVGVGPFVNFKQLAAFASTPDLVLTVDSFDELSTILDSLAERVCTVIDTPTPTPAPVGPANPSPTPTPCVEELNVVWLLDGSGSIGNQFPYELSFGEQVSSLLGVGPNTTHVGIVQFRGDSQPPSADHPPVVIELSLTDNETAVLDTFGSIEQLSEGWTRTDYAVAAGQSMLAAAARPNTGSVLILVTDGLPEDGYLSPPCRADQGCTYVHSLTKIEADKAKAAGTTIIAVGVGPYVRYNRLLDYASGPEFVFQTNSFEELASQIENLTSAVCLPTPTPTPVPVCNCSCDCPEVCPPAVSLFDTTPDPLATPVPPCTCTCWCATPKPCLPPLEPQPSPDAELSPSPEVTETSPTPDVECESQVNVFFLLDGSGSIGNQFPYELNFTQSVINDLDISPVTANVGIIQFRGEAQMPNPANPAVRVEAPLTGDRAELEMTVAGIEQLADGWTRTDLALSRATTLLLASTRVATKVIVLITDGLPEDGYLDPPCRADKGCTTVEGYTLSAAAKARDEGIVIAAVGVGPLVRYNRLVGYASSPSYVFTTESFQTLSTLISNISAIVCAAPPPLVTPGAASTPEPESPSPDLILATPEASTPAESISPAPTPEVVCSDQLNLVWILDGSGSVGDQFPLETDFAYQVSMQLNVSWGDYNIGVLQFRGESNPPDPINNPAVKIETDLTGSPAALSKALWNVKRLQDGWTRLDLAIEAGAEMLNTSVRQVPGVMVIITDGLPEDGYLNPPCYASQQCTTVHSMTMLAAAKAKAEGYTIITVGVGPYVTAARLAQYASSPNYVFTITAFDQLAAFVNNFAQLVCQQTGAGGTDICPDGSPVNEFGLCPSPTPTFTPGPTPTGGPSIAFAYNLCPAVPNNGLYPTQCPPVGQGQNNIPCPATGQYPDGNGLYPNGRGLYPDWQGCYPDCCNQYPGFYGGPTTSYPPCGQVC